MDNAKPVLTIAGSMDAHGNVVVWDHGPQEPDAAHDSAEYKTYEAERQAWEKQSLGLPQPLHMAASDGAQALHGDSIRYALEPVGLEEGEVAAKVKEIQDKRAAAAKAAEANAAAIQLSADRKIAVNAVLAEHRAALEEKKTADAQARRKALPKIPAKPAPAHAAPHKG